jgi:hypothetical protein
MRIGTDSRSNPSGPAMGMMFAPPSGAKMLQLLGKIDRTGKFNTTRSFLRCAAPARMVGLRSRSPLRPQGRLQPPRIFSCRTRAGEQRFLVARGWGGGYNRPRSSSVCGCVARVVTVTHGPGKHDHPDLQISRTTTAHRVSLKEFFGEVPPQDVVLTVRNDSFSRSDRWLQRRGTSGPHKSTTCGDGRNNRTRQGAGDHGDRGAGDSSPGRRGTCDGPRV